MASIKKEISSKIIGDSGENLALDYLKEIGYRVEETNFRSLFGEIDIIARDGECLCFIEVKMRYTDQQGTPFEAITSWKMRHLTKAALCYLQQSGQEDAMCRFDVLGIKVEEGCPTFALLKNAFDAV